MIVAGIATIPTRIEQLRKTIESLAPQVDRISVSLNHFTHLNMCPEWLLYFKIDAVITQGSDEQKFRRVEGDIYLSCDDDLIYPANYVEVIQEKLEQYDIISFHGRNFHKLPIDSYYRSKASRYRCLDKVAQDMPVQFGGTGCMAFKPGKFSVTLNDFPTKYMADIHFAIAARKAGKKIMCIAHESGWIKYQEVGNTIYDRFRNDDAEQTDYANRLFETVAV